MELRLLKKEKNARATCKKACSSESDSKKGPLSKKRGGGKASPFCVAHDLKKEESANL